MAANAATQSVLPFGHQPTSSDDDPRGDEVGKRRPIDAGDVVDVGPTPVVRAVIGLCVGLAVGALLALLLPREVLRRR